MEQDDVRQEEIVHGVDPLISLPLIINNIMNYHQKLRSREFKAAMFLSLYVWMLQYSSKNISFSINSLGCLKFRGSKMNPEQYWTVGRIYTRGKPKLSNRNLE